MSTCVSTFLPSFLSIDGQISILEAKTTKKDLQLAFLSILLNRGQLLCFFHERVLIWVVNHKYIYILTTFREYWCINKPSRGKNDKKMALRWEFLVHFGQSRPVIVVSSRKGTNMSCWSQVYLHFGNVSWVLMHKYALQRQKRQKKWPRDGKFWYILLNRGL